jgi:hypothetical protein
MCNHYQAESRRRHLEAMGLELSPAWLPPLAARTFNKLTGLLSFAARLTTNRGVPSPAEWTWQLGASECCRCLLRM